MDIWLEFTIDLLQKPIFSRKDVRREPHALEKHVADERGLWLVEYWMRRGICAARRQRGQRVDPVAPRPEELEVAQVIREPAHQPIAALELHPVQSIVQHFGRLSQLHRIEEFAYL